MNILTNPKLNNKVYSKLADRMVKAGRLFWLVFNRDESGTGYSFIDIESDAKYFECHPSTIYRQITDCKNHGYFYNVEKISPKIYLVRFKSHLKIAAELNLRGLGRVVWANQAAMYNLKAYITQCEMAALQEQSKYQAKRENKSRRSKVEINREESICDRNAEVHRTVWRGEASIFEYEKRKKKKDKDAAKTYSLKPNKENKSTVDDSEASPNEGSKKNYRRKKVILHVGTRFVVVSSNFIVFGGTQLAISGELRRCIGTIRNRLKGVERKQVLRYSGMSLEQFNGSEHFLGDRKFISFDGVVYEVCPNIYNFKGVEYSSGHKGDERYKKYLSSINNTGLTASDKK